MELPYFELLIAIHNNIFGNMVYRLRLGFTRKEEINLLIGQIICMKEISFEELINQIVKCAAVIVLYQPFLDGNNRTALGLIQYLLEMKGYFFDVNKALNDYLGGDIIIPTIYDKEDEVSFLHNKKIVKYMVKRKKI